MPTAPDCTPFAGDPMKTWRSEAAILIVGIALSGLIWGVFHALRVAAVCFVIFAALIFGRVLWRAFR